MTFIGEKAISAFDEKKVAERTPIISLNSATPLSILRDDRQTSNNGEVNDNSNEYQIRHTDSGDFARLASASRGVYEPGHPAEGGIGVRLDNASYSGSGVAYWGYFDMALSDGSNSEVIDDGVVFGNDSNGFFVALISDETEIHKAHIGEFNQNNLGGSIDLTKGFIFEVDFSFYGYGLIRWKVIMPETGDVNQEPIVLHTYKPEQSASIDKTNLQVGALIKSSNMSSDRSIFVGGRQYSIVGKYRPRSRFQAARNTGIDFDTTSWSHLLSFQRRSDFRQIASQVYDVNISADTACWLMARVNADITGADFNPPESQNSSEVAVTEDTDGTVDATTGIEVLEVLVPGGQNNVKEIMSFEELFVDLPDEATLSFLVQGISQNGTVDAFLAKIEERW